jgi:hypothetical protein
MLKLSFIYLRWKFLISCCSSCLSDTAPSKARDWTLLRGLVLSLLRFVPCSSVNLCSNCARGLISHESLKMTQNVLMFQPEPRSLFWASCCLWNKQTAARAETKFDTKTKEFRNKIRRDNTIWINSETCLYFLPITWTLYPTAAHVVICATEHKQLPFLLNNFCILSLCNIFQELITLFLEEVASWNL